MWPTGPLRVLAGLPRAAERQIIGTRKPVIRGIAVKGVQRYHEERRERWLSDTELKRLAR